MSADKYPSLFSRQMEAIVYKLADYFPGDSRKLSAKMAGIFRKRPESFRFPEVAHEYFC